MRYFTFYFYHSFLRSENTGILRCKRNYSECRSNIYQLIIAHDTIPNLMMPMTMPFFVPDLQELEKLSVGDSVHFELVWDEDKPFSRNFKIIGKGMVSDYDDFFDDEFSEQKVGSVIDDVRF